MLQQLPDRLCWLDGRLQVFLQWREKQVGKRKQKDEDSEAERKRKGMLTGREIFAEVWLAPTCLHTHMLGTMLRAGVPAPLQNILHGLNMRTCF